MGIEGISKSQVSAMAKELDALVEAFRSRPLDAGPYTYIWLDALTQKVREGGRVVNVAVVIATGVNNEGTAGVARLRRHHHRGRGGLDGVLALSGGPGPLGRGPGHLRRPQGPKSGYRRRAAGGQPGSVVAPTSRETC